MGSKGAAATKAVEGVGKGKNQVLEILPRMPLEQRSRRSQSVRTASPSSEQCPSSPEKVTAREYIRRLKVNLEKRDDQINSLRLEMDALRRAVAQGPPSPMLSTSANRRRRHRSPAKNQEQQSLGGRVSVHDRLGVRVQVISDHTGDGEHRSVRRRNDDERLNSQCQPSVHDRIGLHPVAPPREGHHHR